jgi:molybdate transport system substrate-binding protein
MVLVGACAGQGDRQVLVSAAASLTDAFADLESGFESENPGVDVVLNLAATSTLRRQILEGAPVDVFASADLPNMEAVVATGLVSGDPRVFATNRLQIAVAAGNPTGITGLADFAERGRLVGLCAEAVPCGSLARQALDSAGITPSLDSEEPNVKALLTKIASGELDAGIVYVTDVGAEPAVEGIDIAPEHNVENQYAIAVLAGASDRPLATLFVEYVMSPTGQEIIAGHGFGPR